MTAKEVKDRPLIIFLEMYKINFLQQFRLTMGQASTFIIFGVPSFLISELGSPVVAREKLTR